MKYGTLSYNFGSERYEIVYGDGGSRRDLHCGDTLQIEVSGKWIPTRIELIWDTKEWYLEGVGADDWSTGSKVRV